MTLDCLPWLILFLPLLYVFARKLWRLAEEEDGTLEHVEQRWWRPAATLLAAMARVLDLTSRRFEQWAGGRETWRWVS